MRISIKLQSIMEELKKSKNNLLLGLCWAITAICFISIIGTYWANFHEYGRSNDPERWGQFGDYFGGILNPIISILNLIILTYITIHLSKIEDKRNQWTLQELARPLGNIICGDYEDKIEVKFKNCGMGPLIIKEIIVNKNGIIYDNLVKQMPEIPETLSWKDFVIDGKNFVVGKDAQINLIKIVWNDEDPIFNKYKTDLRTSLKDIIIEIKYDDMYGRNMPSVSRNLELFSRNL